MIINQEINDGIILSTCVVLSSVITYFIMGTDATLWSTLSALHVHNILSKPKDYFKSFLFSITILAWIELGYFLKSGYVFYFSLIILSFFYYQLYDIEPALDLSMKYIIIFYTLGTTLAEEVIGGLVIGFLIGTVVTLLVYYWLNYNKSTTRNKNTTKIKKHIFKVNGFTVLSSLVYSAGLMTCLFVSTWYSIGHSFWSLLTFVFVLHPKSKGIIKLTLERIIGGILAVLFLYFLFNTLIMPYVGFFSILALAFLLPSSNGGNYIFTSFCTTGFILSVLEMSLYWQSPSYHLFWERIIETIVGGSIAIFCSVLLRYIPVINEDN